MVYEEFGLIKRSPTVGGYFFSHDYIEFLQKFNEIIYQKIEFIELNESKHREWIIQNNNQDCPIGKLGDVEFVFVHYKSKNEAFDKWIRRVERINFDNLVFKYSMQNHASYEDLLAFDEMELPGKKIMFVNKPNMGFKSGTYYHGFENDDQVYNDTYLGTRHFDMISFFNEGKKLSWK